MHIKQKVFHETMQTRVWGGWLRTLPGECVCMAKNAPFKTIAAVGRCGVGATVSGSGDSVPSRE